MSRGRGKKGYKVSGNRNPPTGRFWSRSEETQIWNVHQMMRRGGWEEIKERYREEDKSSEWTLERIRDAYEKVAKDENGRLAIV